MLKKLRDDRAKLVAQMRDMITAAEGENREFTAEEQTAFDALKAQKTALDARIENVAGVEADEAAGARVIAAVSRGAGVERPMRGPEAKTEFESFGEFMSAVRFNQNDQRLHFVEGVGGADADMDAALRMDNDTGGGFMVPAQFRESIMSVEPQAALVRPRATVIPAGSPPDAAVVVPALDQTGAASKNIFGGVEVKWIAEGEEKPETDAKLRGVKLEPHEVAGLVTVTDKLLRNWQAAGSFIEGLLRNAVLAAEDYAFIRGTGVGQPLGALNAGATKFINRTTANTVLYDDLVAMVARVLMRGDQSPIWSIPQGLLPAIAKMTDPEGHYIWQANAREGFAGTLLGYPVRWNNRQPAPGAKGDVLLADWSYYLIKDGSGPFVAASEHVKFTSNQTVIKVFWNVDGSPWLTAPMQEENGYEVSPFVGLDVPA